MDYLIDKILTSEPHNIPKEEYHLGTRLVNILGEFVRVGDIGRMKLMRKKYIITIRSHDRYFPLEDITKIYIGKMVHNYGECLYYYLTEFYYHDSDRDIGNVIWILDRIKDKFWAACIAKLILDRYADLSDNIKRKLISVIFKRYKDVLLLNYSSDILYLLLCNILRVL